MNVCWFSIEGFTYCFSTGAINAPRKQLPGLCGDSHPPRCWREGCTAGIPAPFLNSLATRTAQCKYVWLSISRKKNGQRLEQQRLQKAPNRCLTHPQQHLAVC